MQYLVHSGSEAFSFVAVAEAVVAAIDAVLVGEPCQAVLVGYSMGARLALYLSTHFGDRLTMTVCVSGNAGISG